MKKQKKKWEMCPRCSKLIFTDHGFGLHRCPEKVVAKIDADLDMIMGEELATWDSDVKNFWRSKDVKFMQWVLGNKDEMD